MELVPKPFHMMQPLEVCHLYFTTSAIDTPNDPISRWLQDKLPGIPDAGLNTPKIIKSFYPLNYEDWVTRQILNLTDDLSSENIHQRGPPPTVKQLLQQCDLFKVHCVTVHAKPLSTHKIRSLLPTFHLDEIHFKLRYKSFSMDISRHGNG